jgi:hypothetical protein
MTSTRGITFASEAQRKAYIRDCRADYLRENPPAAKEFTLEHDTSLVGQTFYLAPQLKGYRLSRDGSTITGQPV